VLLISAFITIVLCFILKSASRGLLLGLTLAGFVMTLILLIACLWIRHRLGTPEPSISDVTWWQDIWEYVYIAAMISLVATITVGGLYEGEAHPVVFWTILAIIVAILIGIAVFWWRSLKS
jgi:hypothetical protein